MLPDVFALRLADDTHVLLPRACAEGSERPPRGGPRENPVGPGRAAPHAEHEVPDDAAAQRGDHCQGRDPITPQSGRSPCGPGTAEARTAIRSGVCTESSGSVPAALPLSSARGGATR